jgi:hypothetical protein
MLATVAALQLVVLSQIAAPKEVRPEDAGVESSPAAEAPASPGEVAQGEENAPLPRKPGSEEPPVSERPAALVPPAPAGPRQLSLLSGESLHGGSASLAWAGWSSLGIMYGQGVTPRDDLAGFLDFDWAKTEMRIGAFFRRSLGKAGDFDMAARLAAAWYMDFGAGWIYGENHADRGVEVTPGLSFSRRAMGGVLSAIADGPLAVTFKYGGGLLFSPRVSLAYETALYPDVTVGARAGLGYRAGSGDAPLAEGRTEFTFLVVGGYQLF